MPRPQPQPHPRSPRCRAEPRPLGLPRGWEQPQQRAEHLLRQGGVQAEIFHMKPGDRVGWTHQRGQWTDGRMRAWTPRLGVGTDIQGGSGQDPREAGPHPCAHTPDQAGLPRCPGEQPSARGSAGPCTLPRPPGVGMPRSGSWHMQDSVPTCGERTRGAGGWGRWRMTGC